LTGKNGAANNLIKIWAYPGEKPTLTRTANYVRDPNGWHRGGIFFSGNYFHWKGIEIKGFTQFDGQVEDGFLA
jgi:hypothetical protein